MLPEVLNTYRKIYKNPLLTNTTQQKNKSVYIDTELLLNEITPDSSFIIPKKNDKKKNKTKNLSTPRESYEKFIFEHKHKHKHEHINCSSCIQCHPYFRMLKKQKNKLVDFINNNKVKNIKLIGNHRYTHASPKKYVYDNNRKLSNRKMGIIPIPLKKRKKITNALESINYYELQRSIVMMRRIQYDRKIRKGILYNFLDNVITIQRWWRDLKKQKKIKRIQKMFRKYLKRKRLKIRIKLKKNLGQINNILNNIICKKCFKKLNQCKYMKKPLFNYILIKKNKNTNNYNYISKNRNIISINSILKINAIQNNYRVHKAIEKKNKLLIERRFKPIFTKHNLFTKIAVNERLLNEKINMLQRNIRFFLKENKNKKKKIFKTNRKKENFGLYIDKIYLTTYILKIIDFNKKLRYVMQLIALRKRTLYKKLNDYNINDIKKISKIQNIYKSHYDKYHINKKDLIKIYSNKSTINCYITKKRLEQKNKALLLIQKAMKAKLERIKFENNIIKNKPKSIYYNQSISFNIAPKPKKKFSIIPNRTNNLALNNKDKNEIMENNNNFEITGINKKPSNYFEITQNENVNISSSMEFKNQNNINYNLVSSITKKRIINVKLELIFLQRKIKLYLFIKKAKKNNDNKSCLFITKIHINKLFFITKEYSNENEYLNKIIYLQQFYKQRYNYFKNNIIKHTISTIEKEEGLKKYPQRMISNFSIYGNNNNNKDNKYYKNYNFLYDNQKNINIIGNKKNINRNNIENDSFTIGNDSNKKDFKNKKKSYQIQNNRFLLLSYLVDKNRKPIQQAIGNYYDKIRVDSKIYDQYLNNKNKFFILLNKSNRGIYISKNRYINNISQITFIQKKIKNRNKKKIVQKEKEKDIIIQKPLIQNYIICEDKIIKDNNENEKINKKKFSKKDKQEKSEENERPNINSFNLTHNSKNKNLYEEEEEDSYFESIDRDFGDLVGEKIYTIYNKNNIVRQPHLYMNNYYYMTKIRRFNEEKDFSSEKEYILIKKELKQRRLEEINKSDENLNPTYPDKFSISISASPKKIQTMISRNSPKIKSKSSKNNIIEKKINSIVITKNIDKKKNKLVNEERDYENSSIFKIINKKKCYIEKIRFKNNRIIQLIKNFIFKNKNSDKNVKKQNNPFVKNIKMKYILNISYIKPINYNCYFTKKRININTTSKKNTKKGSLLNEIKINNTLKKMEIIDKNNFKNNKYNNDIIDNINNSINIINKDYKSNNNPINNINNINDNDLNNRSNINSKKNIYESNYNTFSNYSEKVSNGNNIVTNRNEKDMNKTRRNFNNINISNKINYFHNKINYINFIQLLNLFIVKNAQENIFYKLLYHYQNIQNNTKKYINLYNNSNFNIPFYILTLKRLFKYISKENQHNRRIKSYLYLIFPSLNKNKSFYYHLLCLTHENRKKLINTNLYNINREKNILVQFLDDFIISDIKLYKKNFISDKINKKVFYNTNIFTLIKFLDDEFNKLDRGIYCQNCFQLEKDCNCSNKKFINNFFSNGSDEDNFDFDLNADTESKNGRITVNYFIDEREKEDIDDNFNNEIICIKKKPKITLNDNETAAFNDS